MVYLYGAGGHAKVIIEILEKREIIIGGLLDINPGIKFLLGYNIYLTLDTISHSANELIITIGDNKIRKKLAENLKDAFISAIDLSANVSKRCKIGEGSVVMAGVTINSGVIVGKHVILNTNCSIDHDCIIDNYVHIGPRVALAGNIIVGEGSFIGIGACVIQGIKIGKWVTIGAGTVIIKDVPDYAVVVGNPGKVLKYNDRNS